MKPALLWIMGACLLTHISADAQPTRKINYTVDEGTWVSVDVSPNGQEIVFELVGDIYKMSIDGGKAVPIVTGLAFQSQPRYAPDGKSLTYVSDESGSENIWVA
ncbi:MAG: TolB family protein, partial [Cytophagales bacterium]